MNKDNPIEDGRSKEGKFTTGNKLQKRKCPITKEQMDEAIKIVEANIDISKGKNLLIKLIEWAYTDKEIMKFVVERYVEKANVAQADIKPLQIIIERYYQAEQGKNDKIIDIEAEITE